MDRDKEEKPFYSRYKKELLYIPSALIVGGVLGYYSQHPTLNKQQALITKLESENKLLTRELEIADWTDIR